MQRAIITVGLGFGDCGKGASVDWLCRHFNADLVVRYSGGSQCGHNVQTPGGERHKFAQFGAGVFYGVPTFLGPKVIVFPGAMLQEYRHLQWIGVEPTTVYVHPDCLVTTRYHQTRNREIELERRHGSCGHGIGETRSYALAHKREALTIGDLRTPATAIPKLELLSQRLQIDLGSPTHHFIELQSAIDALCRKKVLRIQEEPPPFETAIFEGAQGVLLDEWWGFHPHTTWSTVTTEHAVSLLSQWDVQDFMVLGITRSYHTRHGNGPLPTYDEKLTTRLVDQGNPFNIWQGDFRCGWLDFVLLKYALTIQPVDAIALNHLDQLPEYVCKGYENTGLNVGIPRDLRYQEVLGRRLETAKPILTRLGGLDEMSLVSALERLAPVVLAGYGPTHEHRGGYGWVREFQFGPRRFSTVS